MVSNPTPLLTQTSDLVWIKLNLYKSCKVYTLNKYIQIEILHNIMTFHSEQNFLVTFWYAMNRKGALPETKTVSIQLQRPTEFKKKDNKR